MALNCISITQSHSLKTKRYKTFENHTSLYQILKMVRRLTQRIFVGLKNEAHMSRLWLTYAKTAAEAQVRRG